MRKRQKIKIADFTNEKKESIQCYFSLLTQDTKYAWVDGAGYSMLPLFWPGCKVRMNTNVSTLDIGQVVLFIQGRKVVAHRLVKQETDGSLLTKGDTLHGFDRPIRAEDIVGFVDAVQRFGRSRPVKTDPDLAALSSSLGDKILKKFSYLPPFLQKTYYFICFIPCFIYLKAKRRMLLLRDSEGV